MNSCRLKKLKNFLSSAQNGETPLLVAASINQTSEDLTKLLLKYGAGITNKKFSSFPFLMKNAYPSQTAQSMIPREVCNKNSIKLSICAFFIKMHTLRQQCTLGTESSV
jgi:hypothetical protein